MSIICTHYAPDAFEYVMFAHKNAKIIYKFYEKFEKHAFSHLHPVVDEDKEDINAGQDYFDISF